MVLAHLCVKFEDTSFYTLEVMPRTKIQSQYLQRAITKKVNGIELWFLYTALLHNVTYLCMKFEVASFHTFEVIARTKFHDTLTDVRTDGQGDSSIPPKLCLWGYNHSLSYMEFAAFNYVDGLTFCYIGQPFKL